MYDLDFIKLIIFVLDLGIMGYDVEKWMCEVYNIEVEMFDFYNILCIIMFGDIEEDLLCLVMVLCELFVKFYNFFEIMVKLVILLFDIFVLVLIFCDVFYVEIEVVFFYELVGCIIVEFVMVYFFGIFIFIFGEIIIEENLIYIEINLEVGLLV